mgnify:CR=1 FL=1
MLRDRRKDYDVLSVMGIALTTGFMHGSCSFRPSYHTQIEVALGLGGTVRLGINPGEMADFVLGWLQIDLFHDDVYRVGAVVGQESGVRNQ